MTRRVPHHHRADLYFVPLTQLATVLTWALWWRNRDEDVRAHDRRAGLASLADPARLNPAAWAWNALNVVRMFLTATTGWSLFQALRTLDRHG